MAKINIKSVSKSDMPETGEGQESLFSIYSGFKLGFGMFLGFLTGIVILAALTALIWYGMLAVR